MTDLDKTASRLVTGQTAYQIFSTDKYIFKVTPTFETLYRIGFYRESSSGGNGLFLADRDNSNIFRRVRYGEVAMNFLRKCKKYMIHGFPSRFLHTEYRLYRLIDQLNRGGGYMLVKCGLDSGDEKNQMYFIKK